jgi:integrase
VSGRRGTPRSFRAWPLARPSKSLTLAQAEALFAASEYTSLHAYIVVSLLTGARTEEIRALTWSYVDLVFPSRVGTPADASHVRRSFRTVVAAAGLDPHEWTPRE